MIHGRVRTRLFSVLMAAVVLLSLLPASAAEERQVVRVAFPEQAGMSTVNGSGKLTGYNYDYLEKISEFTGWKMEYVFYPAEDGNEAVGSAIRDLVDGKVDLLGPMLKNEQTEQLYEYPENSYGTVYTTLCSDIGNPIRRSGLNSATTFRIGLWETAKTRNAEVMRFLSSENINYEIYYYPTSDAQQEALHSGEVDLISGLSLSPMVNTRIVAKFAARPYYFASTKGNTALIEQLDAAMAQIEALQPELQEHLFDAYFLEPVNAFYLTDAQREALSGIGQLKVLCVDMDAPYVYQYKGEASGALVLALNDFAQKVGVKPVYTFCSNREEAQQLIAAEEFDLLIGIPFAPSFCAENDFVRTDAVFSTGMALVRSKHTESYENETLAIVQGLESAFDTAAFQQVLVFDNAAQCIAAVQKGRADVAAGDGAVMDHYIYETDSTMLTSDISGKTHDVCIAVSRSRDLPLLGPLNSYINSLSTYDRTLYLDAGNVYQRSLSLPRLVAQHPVAAISIAGAMAALLVASVLMAVYSASMNRKNRELAKANQVKSDFLSRMSHDIRTPLNGIIGLLKIDENHFDNPALLVENHHKMNAAANHLLSLVNDVLQMSKLESGTETMEMEPMYLPQISAEVVAILRERAMEGGIAWEADVPLAEPFPYVYGSPLHLRQIFLNIYGNCIKFTNPGGKITTHMECLSRNKDTVTYRWTISDTGIGMSEEFLKHIFDPFVQENSSARSQYQGTGLGMSIVKSLIDRMNGTIEVTSKQGVGSTFVITLPFQIAQKPAERPKGEGASLRGLRLLLAEDNSLNAEIAQTLLTDEGAVVTTAANGQQAVDMFNDSPAGTFDAILMDVMMPVMDGLTATRTIRALPRPDAKQIPIIAMTANAFAEDARRCIAAGMNAHLAKPLEMEKVKQTISEQVRK